MTEKTDVCSKPKSLWEKAANGVKLPGALIAIFLAGIEANGYFKGPETILFPPQQILLKAYQYPANTKEYLRLSSRMAYVNDGYDGYNSIIIQEKVRFSIAGKNYEQTGLSYETFRYKDRQLVSDYHSDAKPLPVNAGSSESHETFFAPKQMICESAGATGECQTYKHFIEWGQFMRIAGEAGQIEFTLIGDLHAEDNVSGVCTVKIDNEAVYNMALLGYAPLMCVTNTVKLGSIVSELFNSTLSLA